MTKYLVMGSFDAALMNDDAPLGKASFSIGNSRGQSMIHIGEVVADRPAQFDGSLYASFVDGVLTVERVKELLLLSCGRKVRIVGASDFGEGSFSYIDENGKEFRDLGYLTRRFAPGYVEPGLIATIEKLAGELGSIRFIAKIIKRGV